MNLSISTLVRDIKIYPDVYKTLEFIKNLGSNHVDIAAMEGWQDHISPSRLGDEDYYNSLSLLINNSGLTADAINAGFKYQITTKDKEQIKSNLSDFDMLCKFADTIGAKSITLGPGVIKSRSDVEINMEMLKNNIPALADKAERYGINLSLECHEGSTLERIEEVEEAMDFLFPHAGLTIDPSHTEMQDISLEAFIPLVKYAYHVHIRPASLGNMQQTLDKNTVDFEKFIKILRDGGYDGTIAIELFNNFDNGDTLIPFIKVLQDLGLNF